VTRKTRGVLGSTSSIQERSLFRRSKTESEREAERRKAREYTRSMRVFGGKRKKAQLEIQKMMARQHMQKIMVKDEAGRVKVCVDTLKSKNLHGSLEHAVKHFDTGQIGAMFSDTKDSHDGESAELKAARMFKRKWKRLKQLNSEGGRASTKRPPLPLFRPHDRQERARRPPSADNPDGTTFLDARGRARTRARPAKQRPRTSRELLPDFYGKGVDHGLGPKSDHEIVRRARRLGRDFGRAASYRLVKEALVEQFGADTYRRYKRHCVLVMQEEGIKVQMKYVGARGAEGLARPTTMRVKPSSRGTRTGRAVTSYR
jgi:hypothetical protein